MYKDKYPDCRNPDSKYSDIYVKLVLEATGGGSKYNDYDSENKIMKKIAKVITIDKSEFLTNSWIHFFHEVMKSGAKSIIW